MNIHDTAVKRLSLSTVAAGLRWWLPHRETKYAHRHCCVVVKYVCASHVQFLCGRLTTQLRMNLHTCQHYDIDVSAAHTHRTAHPCCCSAHVHYPRANPCWQDLTNKPGCLSQDRASGGRCSILVSGHQPCLLCLHCLLQALDGLQNLSLSTNNLIHEELRV